jgi:two-component system, OmpR family, sensor histidine kinase VicK
VKAGRKINFLSFLLAVTTIVLLATSVRHQHLYLIIVAARMKNYSGYLSQLQVHSRKWVDTKIIKSKIKCKKLAYEESHRCNLVFIRRCEYLINTTIPSYPPNVVGNKSEILYGIEKAVGRGVYFMSNVKERMDICFDHSAPSIVATISEYKNGYVDIRRRGGKIRAFTEITKDNIAYCKELTKLVDELRHLDGVKGGLAISESEYMATTVLKETEPLTQVIYSNVPAVVEQGQYIFDTLWNTATPAEQKIREMEKGTVHYESKVLENHDEIFKQIVHLAETSTGLSIVSSFGGMQLIYNNFFDLYKKMLDKYRKGEGKGIRWACSIEAESIDLVKIFLNLGMQLKHVKNLTPMSFAIGDKELNATVDSMKGGKMIQTLLTSNEPIYIKHFSSIFEELWNNGIDASDKIRDIEQGIDQANIENISNPKEGIKRAWSIIRAAKEEVLIMFSSANAVRRQKEMGGLQLLKEASEERNVRVRVLTPADEDIKSTTIEEAKSMYPQVDIRIIDKSLQTRITIVLVDKKECVIVELKDDAEDNSYNASGLTTYSNSKSIVSSYISIFESFWQQSELHKQLEESNKQLTEANEQLNIHDKIQSDFINIAAHELRTPIQPILGLSEVLRSKLRHTGRGVGEGQEILDIIIRNAKRLQRLAEDILDVTRIESQSLKLIKERFDLNEPISKAVQDYRNQIEKDNRGIKLLYSPSKEDIVVEADRSRLIQVISNLLSNAVKFTTEGTISISTEKKDNQVIVSVKDNGSGIDSEILPRLFSKFSAKSFEGTGLGLFISKNIVEAHGGKIWAENNDDHDAYGQKGATFYFMLPLTNQPTNNNN